MSQTMITLYTRTSCPLCEKAKVTLEELKKEWAFQLEEIDIESSDELIERYGLMIPVVHINGEEIGYGIVDKFALINRLKKKAN